MNKALFEYRLRESFRARNVRLCVSVARGLEVIVPSGYDVTSVPDLLERKRKWILAALERAEADRELYEPKFGQLPQQIPLPSIQRTWKIDAKESDADRISIRETGSGVLSIHGRLSDQVASRAALNRWLMREANRYLVPWFDRLGKDLDFRYRRVCIRRQRTRWGSCSSRKTIALNAKLLFLQPELVNAVMIHELCHLIEMNHSKRFWVLVERYNPDFRSHDKLLHDAWKMVPWWAS